jgi:hypothetical protein
VLVSRLECEQIRSLFLLAAVIPYLFFFLLETEASSSALCFLFAALRSKPCSMASEAKVIDEAIALYDFKSEKVRPP